MTGIFVLANIVYPFKASAALVTSRMALVTEA
jgi:hypothetical protein